MMLPTEADLCAMALSDEELWKLVDYALVENSREGNLTVTAARLWVQNHGLAKGDEAPVYLHKPTGALVVFPADQAPRASQPAIAEG